MRNIFVVVIIIRSFSSRIDGIKKIMLTQSPVLFRRTEEGGEIFFVASSFDDFN